MLPTQTRRAALTLLELLVVISIIGTLLGLTVAGVFHVRKAYDRAEVAEWRNQRRLGGTNPRSVPIKVLFIGNSYTFVNDLPGAVQALGKAAGGKPELIVESVTVGGAKLKDHWDAGTAAAKIAADDWDIVVLQEQSQTPLPRFGRSEFFVPYGKEFDKVIRKRGAITMFYMTWKRPDTPGTHDDWIASYLQLTKELGAEVAPAGMTLQAVEAKLPGFGFYADQGGHPTPAGTYLVACAFYAAIYDKPPTGLPNSVTTAGGTTVGVSAAEAPVVQQAAWDSLLLAKRRLR